MPVFAMPGRSGNMLAFVNVVPPPVADAIGSIAASPLSAAER
ncbi:hypothetical protein [Roseiflexus sp.]